MAKRRRPSAWTEALPSATIPVLLLFVLPFGVMAAMPFSSGNPVTNPMKVTELAWAANFLGGSTLPRVRHIDGRSLLIRETHAGERPSRAPGDAVGLMWNDQDTVVLEG